MQLKYYTSKFLLILLILCLPVQGIAAAFHHCAHQSNANHELNGSIDLITDDYLHNVDHQQTMNNYMVSDQACEANTLCHASCSTPITATHSTSIPISDSSFHESLNANTFSFIPDLPQHPPRT